MLQSSASKIDAQDLDDRLVQKTKGFLGYLYKIEVFSIPRIYHVVHYPMRKCAWVLNIDAMFASPELITDVTTIMDVSHRLYSV